MLSLLGRISCTYANCAELLIASCLMYGYRESHGLTNLRRSGDLSTQAEVPCWLPSGGHSYASDRAGLSALVAELQAWLIAGSSTPPSFICEPQVRRRLRSFVLARFTVQMWRS